MIQQCAIEFQLFLLMASCGTTAALLSERRRLNLQVEKSDDLSNLNRFVFFLFTLSLSLSSVFWRTTYFRLHLFSKYVSVYRFCLLMLLFQKSAIVWSLVFPENGLDFFFFSLQAPFSRRLFVDRYINRGVNNY